MKFNDRAAQRYAARFRAEMEIVGPEPTDDAMRRAFANCCRIPTPELYGWIRAYIGTGDAVQSVLPLEVLG
jgi:hypothetical protein